MYTTVDYIGLQCPLPVIKAYKLLKKSSIGEQYLFISDDRSAPEDFKHMCDNFKYQLLSIKKKGKKFLIHIKV